MASDASSWKFTTKDGMEYTFGKISRDTDVYGNTRGSSWSLTEIVSPLGEKVTFTYLPDYNVGTTYYYSERIANSTQERDLHKDYDLQNYQEAVISRIDFTNGYVLFENGKDRQDLLSNYKLNKVIVKRASDNVTVKEFDFSYSYFLSDSESSTNKYSNRNFNNIESKRLRLDKVTETSKPPYIFTYNGVKLPNKTSFSKDYWGYYNGVKNTTQTPSIFYEPDGVRVGTFANRLSNELFMKAGILQSIKYPSGSSMIYEYEPHLLNPDQVLPEEAIIEKFESSYMVYDNQNHNTKREITFTAKNDLGAISYSLNCQNSSNCPLVDNSTWYVSLTRTDVFPHEEIFRKSFSATNLSSNVGWAITSLGVRDFPILVKGATYMLKSIVPQGIEGDAAICLSFYGPTKSVPGRVIYSGQTIVGGGLRIKTITSEDGLLNKSTKVYAYSDLGLLMAPLKFHYYLNGVLSIYSYPSIPLSTSAQGSTVGYGMVSVLEGENGENGKTEYTFTNYADIIPPDLPGTPSEGYVHNGNMESNTVFVNKNGAFSKTEENVYEYSTLKNAKYISGYKILNTNPPGTVVPICNRIVFSRYDINSDWGYLKASIHKIYDPSDASNTKFQQTTNEYFYDATPNAYANGHMQMVKTKTTTSEGKKIVTETTYPADYAYTSGFTLAMKNAFMHVYPVETITYEENGDGTNKQILGGAINIYNNNLLGTLAEKRTLESSNNKPIAYSSFVFSKNGIGSTFTNDSQYKRRVRNTYDSYGNLTRTMPENDFATSYIYGYNSTLPIAQITNGITAQVAYTSFENRDANNIEEKWKTTSSLVLDNSAYTGRNVYQGVVSTTNGLEPGIYKLSFWVKNTDPVNDKTVSYTILYQSPVSFTIPKNTNNWVYREFELSLTNSQSISLDASNVFIDELRLHSVNTLLATTTFDPFIGSTSVCDINGTTSYTEYDAYGRPYLIRDFNKNILKRIEYNWGLANGSQNFVRATDVLVHGKKFENDLSALTSDQSAKSINFSDGLGRTIQSVVWQGSPGKKDIVLPIVYDAFGRVVKSYLPYASNSNTGTFYTGALSSQAAFYNDNTGDTNRDKIVNDRFPYAETVYEASPYSKVLEVGAPGVPWQPASSGVAGSGYTKKISNRLNNADEVRWWKFDINSTTFSASATSFYPACSLTVKELKTEDGGSAIEFTDSYGRVVLKKELLNITSTDAKIWGDTYYVYDIYGNIRYIIPQNAIGQMASLPTTWTFTYDDAICKNLMFSYKYDNRQRLIESRKPGASHIYVIYNSIDKPVLVQDGNQRSKSQWSFIKYDVLGRAVMSGTFTDSRSVSDIQMSVNSQSFLFEVRAASSTSFSYTERCYPSNTITGYEVLSVNYYDDYKYETTPPAYASVSGYTSTSSGFNQEIRNNNLGVLTGTRVKVLGGTTFLKSHVFYDKYGRILQLQSNNHVKTSLGDRVTNLYDFAGRLLKQQEVHGGNSSITIVRRFEYDHAGRLKKSFQKTNNDAEIELSQINYNEIGQVVEKNIHYNGTSYLQSVDFTYNIRGWLTHINNSTLAAVTNGSNNNNDDNDFWGAELLYNNGISGVTWTPKYDGSISGIKWKTRNNKYASSTSEKAYRFEYSQSNQLNHARTFELTTSWGLKANNRESFTYDSHGNIKTLIRVSDAGTLIDNLTYTYDENNRGNKLLKVVDASSATVGFKDVTPASGDDYSYDANGNMIVDVNKGITSVTYNVLNLPSKITFSNGTSVEYIYDAAGTKLRKIFTNGTSSVTDYVKGFVYSGTSLQYFLHQEGRTIPTGTTSPQFRNEYFIKDHLGNTRISFIDNNGIAEVTQENHYYPFGMGWTTNWTGGSTGNGNLYQFSGKEKQQETEWYDFGARMYDHALGRWHSQDPLDQYASGYVYCGNNPLNMIDPTGMSSEKITEDSGILKVFLELGELTGNGESWGRDLAKNRGGGLDGWFRAENKPTLGEQWFNSSGLGWSDAAGNTWGYGGVNQDRVNIYSRERDGDLDKGEGSYWGYWGKVTADQDALFMGEDNSRTTAQWHDLDLSPWMKTSLRTIYHISSDFVNSFVLTGSTLLAPIINQINVGIHEGIHEGAAYDRSLNIAKPYSLVDWKLQPRSLNNNVSYEFGKELMHTTTNAALFFIPLKPALNTGIPFINSYGPKAIDFGSKFLIKQTRDRTLNAVGD